MDVMRIAEKSGKRAVKDTRSPKTILRYHSREHHEMVRRCAELTGLSINSWIIRVTLRAARKEMRELMEKDSAAIPISTAP
jgi:hypothetical protein